MKSDPRRKKKGEGRQLIEALVFAGILALLLKTFVFQLFKIPSGSMEPTLLVGDQLVVFKFSYGIQLPLTHIHLFKDWKPKRGDVIVFRYPKDPSTDFIKRVIAVGGETVEIRAKEIYINGERIEDPWGVYDRSRDLPARFYNRDYYGPVTVPEGKLFVMGDNRDNSHDSRFWGFVDLDAVLGKASFIYWSWDQEEKRVRRERIGKRIE